MPSLGAWCRTLAQPCVHVAECGRRCHHKDSPGNWQCHCQCCLALLNLAAPLGPLFLLVTVQCGLDFRALVLALADKDYRRHFWEGGDMLRAAGALMVGALSAGVVGRQCRVHQRQPLPGLPLCCV